MTRLADPAVPRRSPISLEGSGVQGAVVHGQRLVARYCSDGEDEVPQASHLGLCDLSVLDRGGVKGRAARDWLIRTGWQLPDSPNEARVQPSGDLVARLSIEEHLILRDPWLGQEVGQSTLFDSLDAQTMGTTPICADGVYSLPRQDSHAWLFLSGERASTMMSFVCGVDLSASAFPINSVAQTTVATVNAIVISQHVNALRGFHILCDSTTANWFWNALLDAAKPLQGSAVGWQALAALAQR